MLPVVIRLWKCTAAKQTYNNVEKKNILIHYVDYIKFIIIVYTEKKKAKEHFGVIVD